MVSEQPDVLVGDLTAEATSPTPVDVQRKVNGMMSRAMKDAVAVAGVEPRATGYAVSQVDLDEDASQTPSRPHRMAWKAQQTLELRGKDGERLLALAGKLQNDGLAIASLEWQLSPDLARSARDGAMVKAIQALQARADKAAQALGLKVDRLEDVRVDMPDVAPVPLRPMMAMRASAAPPPEATASQQETTSEVSAGVLLKK
jgi:uncharacterized protein YggE